MINDHTVLPSLAGSCALPSAKKRWSTPEIMNLETTETAALGKLDEECETQGIGPGMPENCAS